LIPNRRCPYCQQAFQPSPYRLQQRACSQAECQRRRRADYHRQKIRTDPFVRAGGPSQPEAVAAVTVEQALVGIHQKAWFVIGVQRT
jgi:hypothetical protein